MIVIVQSYCTFLLHTFQFCLVFHVHLFYMWIACILNLWVLYGAGTFLFGTS